MPPPAPAAPQSATYTRLSAEEYKRALQVFYARSDSHRLLAEFVEREVVPLLGATPTAPAAPGGGEPTPSSAPGSSPSRQYSLLDVGAGDASLCARLLPLFPGGALAVDINAALLLGGSPGGGCSSKQCGGAALQDGGGGSLPSLPGGGVTAPGSICRVVADFLQLELPPGCRFHLVLASHVLYQMPRDVIAAMLCKAARCCAPGGRVLVALTAPRGLLWRFQAELQPDAVISQTVCEVLDGLGLPYSVTPTRDVRNCVDSEAELRLVLKFVAEEAAMGGLAGGGEGAEQADAAAAAAAAARVAALIDCHVAQWPRGEGGAFLLHEDYDLILVRPS